MPAVFLNKKLAIRIIKKIQIRARRKNTERKIDGNVIKQNELKLCESTT